MHFLYLIFQDFEEKILITKLIAQHMRPHVKINTYTLLSLKISRNIAYVGRRSISRPVTMYKSVGIHIPD